MIKTPPTIAYIVNSLNMGGTEQLVVQMSQALSGDYRVTVICLDEPGSWASDLRRSGIPVHSFYRQPGLDISMAYRIARFSKRHRVRIIHAHQCTPWFYAALSRYIYGHPKLLFEEHGRHYPEVDNWKKRAVNRRVVQPMTHRTVAVSKDVKDRLVRYEGVPESAIEIVYNGVRAGAAPTPEEKSRIRADFGFSTHDVVVGFVGRFDAVKNLPLLIDSLQAAKKSFPSLKALLIGDGPESENIRRRVEDKGLSDAVVFTGYREGAAVLARCLDLFVLPSFSEGTSLALLEAMAAGVAVAVSQVGGNPEIVRGGETGWVFASDSRSELGAVIAEAIRCPEIRERYAQRGLERFRDTFAFDVMIDRYKEIYNQILRQG